MDQKFNPSEAWRQLASMPESRLAGAAVTLGDFIYIVGGTGGWNALPRYDPALNERTSLASTRPQRYRIARSTRWVAFVWHRGIDLCGGV